MHSVEISFLNNILIVCWLLQLYKTPAFGGPLVPKSVTSYSYSIWPLASYLFRWFLRSQPFFTRDAYCITRPCYSFLSVLPSLRPSVSRKVCPRRRAVSLRQVSFLWIQGGKLHFWQSYRQTSWLLFTALGVVMPAPPIQPFTPDHVLVISPRTYCVLHVPLV